MRDPGLFASIRDGTTLSHLNVFGEVLPDFRSVSFFSCTRHSIETEAKEFRLSEWILTIGDPKHSMGPLNRLANRCLIAKVRLRSISSAPPDLWARRYLDDFNPFVGQGFGGSFGRVSGNAADLVLLGQGGMGKHALHNGTTLLAGGAKDCKNLTHGRVDCLPLWDLGVGKKSLLRMFSGKNGSKTVDEGCR